MNEVISLQERRKHPRVSDAVALKIIEGIEESAATAIDSAPTHIVKMSCGGLRFVHDTPLDTGVTLLLSMRLASVDKTVHLTSRVIASGEEKTVFSSIKSYFVQVQFENIDLNVQQLLENHINYVIEKTGVKNRAVGYTG